MEATPARQATPPPKSGPLQPLAPGNHDPECRPNSVNQADFCLPQTATHPSSPGQSSPDSSRYSIFSAASDHSHSTSTSISSTNFILDTNQAKRSPSPPFFTSQAGSTPRRNRRNKSDLQVARQQRSISNPTDFSALVKAKGTSSPVPPKRFKRSAEDATAALAAIEPIHDPSLTKMAFADQQRWVTVQQKTFTKWYAPPVRGEL
jgi:hypothetical protein